MASPLKSGKQPVTLAPGGARVSKIRRDPPPAAKQTVVPDRDEQDRTSAAIGIAVVALALLVAIVGIGSWAGWTPSQYTIHIRLQ